MYSSCCIYFRKRVGRKKKLPSKTSSSAVAAAAAAAAAVAAAAAAAAATATEAAAAEATSISSSSSSSTAATAATAEAEKQSRSGKHKRTSTYTAAVRALHSSIYFGFIFDDEKQHLVAPTFDIYPVAITEHTSNRATRTRTRCHNYDTYRRSSPYPLQ